MTICPSDDSRIFNVVSVLTEEEDEELEEVEGVGVLSKSFN
jgi:hypothetical protein